MNAILECLYAGDYDGEDKDLSFHVKVAQALDKYGARLGTTIALSTFTEAMWDLGYIKHWAHVHDECMNGHHAPCDKVVEEVLIVWKFLDTEDMGTHISKEMKDAILAWMHPKMSFLMGSDFFKEQLKTIPALTLELLQRYCDEMV